MKICYPDLSSVASSKVLPKIPGSERRMIILHVIEVFFCPYNINHSGGLFFCLMSSFLGGQNLKIKDEFPGKPTLKLSATRDRLCSFSFCFGSFPNTTEWSGMGLF